MCVSAPDTRQPHAWVCIALRGRLAWMRLAARGSARFSDPAAPFFVLLARSCDAQPCATSRSLRSPCTSFFGPTLMYVDASVTSELFTTTEVCDALMGCADRAKLEVPSVRATPRQFIFELRHGDEGWQRFLDPPATGREDAVEESPSDSEK